MKRIILCICLFIFIRTEAQQINPVPDYVFSNKMSVGRNAVTDTAAYFSIGPRYGAVRGFMPPMVTDTATITTGKRNGLTIFSIQKNKYMYWDSVRVRWSDFAGSSGAYIFASDTASMLNPYTRGSGTVNYVPKFTGARTFGNSKIYDNGSNVGIGTTTPIAPVSLGNGNYYPSSDPYLLLSRLFDDSNNQDSINGHSFSESSIINRSGNTAFAAYETRGKIVGSNNYDHYVSFQAGHQYRSTGSILHHYGLYNVLQVDSGTVTNAYGLYLQNPTVNSPGVITNNYGLYIADQTSGTNKYNIYSNSDARSYFKGPATFSKIRTNETDATTLPAAEIEINTNSGVQADLRIRQLGQNYWDLKIPANQTYLEIADVSGSKMVIQNSGNVGISQTSPAYTLDVNGRINSSTNYSYFGGHANTSVYFGSFSDEGRIGAGGRSTFPTANLTFYTAEGTGNFERMRVTSAGEVLIGTTTDAGAYALQVAGSIYSTTGAVLAALSGNVGIGTTSPLAKLHIADSSSGAIVTPLFVTNSAKNTALGQGAQIGFTNYGDASSTLSASIRSTITNVANGASHLQFYVNSGTAFNESMRITSGSNVGINQTAPLGRFHVVGGASNNAQILVGYSNNSENYFDADTNIFRNGSFVESMRINSNRELLINTSSDAGTYALQVAGNIYTTGSAVINNTNISGTTPFITGSNVTAASGSGMAIGTVSSNNLFFYTNNAQAGFFNSAGELLITNGSTDAGAYALQVTGSIYNTTGAVFAASSGNVGIGLTTPDAGLEIRRPGTIDHLTFSRSVSVGNAGIKIGGNTLALVFENNSATELMRLTIGGELLIGTTTDAGAYALQVAGAIYNTTTITTGAPTGGSIKPWRLGEAATVSPTSPNRTIRVEIDGTVYYIHAKTTND